MRTSDDCVGQHLGLSNASIHVTNDFSAKSGLQQLVSLRLTASRLPFASSVDGIKLRTTHNAACMVLVHDRFAVADGVVSASGSNWFATIAASAAPCSAALLDSRIDRVAGVKTPRTSRLGMYKYQGKIRWQHK